jgi:hypothetical protein
LPNYALPTRSSQLLFSKVQANGSEKQRKRKARIKKPRKSFDLSQLESDLIQLEPSALRDQNGPEMETNSYLAKPEKLRNALKPELSLP